jgi:hypothetical protein
MSVCPTNYAQQPLHHTAHYCPQWKSLTKTTGQRNMAMMTREVEIGVLCSKMGLKTRPAILAFREYRDAQSQQTLQNRPVPSHLQVLEHAVETYVVSTAECERSFSVMNDTLTPISGASVGACVHQMCRTPAVKVSTQELRSILDKEGAQICRRNKLPSSLEKRCIAYVS